MKRGGAEVAPAHLERVLRTPQQGCSSKCQALSQGRRAPLCFVMNNFKHATPCCLEALLPRQLDVACAAMLPCASFRAAVSCHRSVLKWVLPGADGC